MRKDRPIVANSFGQNLFLMDGGQRADPHGAVRGVQSGDQADERSEQDRAHDQPRRDN